MRRDFDRFGIAYMPCTIAGWCYLFGFVLAMLAIVFLVRAVWDASGLPGVDVAQGLILVAGVVATVRFAHTRSK